MDTLQDIKDDLEVLRNLLNNATIEEDIHFYENQIDFFESLIEEREEDDNVETKT